MSLFGITYMDGINVLFLYSLYGWDNLHGVKILVFWYSFYGYKHPIFFVMNTLIYECMQAFIMYYYLSHFDGYTYYLAAFCNVPTCCLFYY